MFKKNILIVILNIDFTFKHRQNTVLTVAYK